MPLLALLPGAQSGTPVQPEFQLPLGTILVGDVAHWCSETDLLPLARVREVSPWAPLCLICDTQPPETVRGVISFVTGGSQIITVNRESKRGLVDEIRASVGSRGSPRKIEFVDYFRSRLGDALGSAVSRALENDDRRALRGYFQWMVEFPVHPEECAPLPAHADLASQRLMSEVGIDWDDLPALYSSGRLLVNATNRIAVEEFLNEAAASGGSAFGDDR